jgi:hypothetical protein
VSGAPARLSVVHTQAVAVPAVLLQPMIDAARADQLSVGAWVVGVVRERLRSRGRI